MPRLAIGLWFWMRHRRRRFCDTGFNDQAAERGTDRLSGRFQDAVLFFLSTLILQGVAPWESELHVTGHAKSLEDWRRL